VILLPRDLPEEAQAGIVCHELVHVRRRDWLFALFEEGVRALLWFHPGVWMLLARIALCREQVVDREAVRLTGSRRAYLEALRTIACRSWQPAFGLPFFHRGHLRERVAHLCKEVSMSRTRTATLLTASAGLLALTAVLAILVFPMSPLSGTAWAKTYKVEGNVQAPKALNTPPPVYPESAKTAKIEGIAVVDTVIDAAGHVTHPKIKATSGDKDLDQAAIDAVSQWTFKPATLDGKPVEVYYTLTIRFALS
jgi:TonB family protein